MEQCSAVLLAVQVRVLRRLQAMVACGWEQRRHVPAHTSGWAVHIYERRGATGS